MLKRELGTIGATMMGLGSILGTGVFVSIGIAAGAAGPAVLISIGIAAILALCNALSSAQLAAAHPVSGGAYEYGYEYLHPAFGFTAGWVFLLAKSASAATAALGFSGYLLYLLGMDAPLYLSIVAVAAVIILTLVVIGGIRRSAVVNTVIVSLTLLALVAFVLAGAPLAIEKGGGNFRPFFSPAEEGRGAIEAILFASALMFVGYAGYARIATLGEEVREPRRTIPRAIVSTLAATALLYAGVASVAIGTAGPERMLAATEGEAAPLEIIARDFTVPGVPLLIAVGAITAMLGVLLNLILGLSRVLLAMARRKDVPAFLARIDGPGQTPRRAVLAVGILVTALAAIGSIRLAWTFSAFTVLIYYAITNLAALQLEPKDRLFPRAFAWGGLGGCLFLAFWVDAVIWTTGLALIALGLVWHSIARRYRRMREGS